LRILTVGDVFGAPGRKAVKSRLPALREQLAIDFVVANGENAAHGAGITPRIAADLLDAGIDVITLGNHAFDEKQILVHLEREHRILRPVNIARRPPGAGSRVFPLPDGQTVLVVNALGQHQMPATFGNAFAMVDEILEAWPLGRTVSAAVVDFHAETTSEKTAMGVWCDGRASLVVGTHTHVPTADARVLPGGTAYQTDLGMTGCYDSVIGMDKTEPLRRFADGMRGPRPEPAEGEATFSAVLVETDPATGLARSAASVVVGGCLEQRLPSPA